MDTHSHLVSLYNDLGNLNPSESAQWSVGQVFNALLARANEDHPNDPVLKAIAPVEPGGSSGQLVSHTTAGTLRTLVGQVMTVYI